MNQTEVEYNRSRFLNVQMQYVLCHSPPKSDGISDPRRRPFGPELTAEGESYLDLRYDVRSKTYLMLKASHKIDNVKPNAFPVFFFPER